MLTKDEVSDLKYLIEAARMRAVDLIEAQRFKDDSERKLENWLSKHTEIPGVVRAGITNHEVAKMAPMPAGQTLPQKDYHLE